jgi:2'-5' RNA ligase
VRVFVAIDLSDDARAAISATEAELADIGRGSAVRFVRPEHLHLTLAFVGNLPEGLASQLAAELTPDISQPVFELAFGGLGVFPERGAPRALWLGILEGESATLSLQRVVVGRLAGMGLEPERRPFCPHLTLARWRNSRRSDRPRQLGDRRLVAVTPVQGITLYESRPTSSGPRYTVLARALLRGGLLDYDQAEPWRSVPSRRS